MKKNKTYNTLLYVFFDYKIVTCQLGKIISKFLTYNTILFQFKNILNEIKY